MQRETSIQIAGYPATPVGFAHGTVAVSLYRVIPLEDQVDRESLLRDDINAEPPSWRICGSARSRSLGGSPSLTL